MSINVVIQLIPDIYKPQKINSMSFKVNRGVDFIYEYKKIYFNKINFESLFFIETLCITEKITIPKQTKYK